jgi:hypothetical protein
MAVSAREVSPRIARVVFDGFAPTWCISCNARTARRDDAKTHDAVSDARRAIACDFRHSYIRRSTVTTQRVSHCMSERHDIGTAERHGGTSRVSAEMLGAVAGITPSERSLPSRRSTGGSVESKHLQ